MCLACWKMFICPEKSVTLLSHLHLFMNQFIHLMEEDKLLIVIGRVVPLHWCTSRYKIIFPTQTCYLYLSLGKQEYFETVILVCTIHQLLSWIFHIMFSGLPYQLQAALLFCYFEWDLELTPGKLYSADSSSLSDYPHLSRFLVNKCLSATFFLCLFSDFWYSLPVTPFLCFLSFL